MIVFERVGFVFIFNFNLIESFFDYCIGIEVLGIYWVVFNIDLKVVGGFNWIDEGIRFFMILMEWNGWKNWIYVYILSWIVMVLVLEDIL